ncbi:MAG: hypothetical protein WCF26_08455 [Candidatus Sulfotelmatobacter sp.]
MNLRRSVLCEIAIRSKLDFVGVDVNSLLQRLILFDRVVLKSFRLREISALIRAFGRDGFRSLLSLGIIKLSCEFTVLAGGFAKNGARSTPHGHLSFGIVDAYDRDGTLRTELRALQGIPGLKDPERSELEELVWASFLRPPANYGKGLLAQVEADIRGNSPVFRTAVVEQIKKQCGGAVTSPNKIVIEVEEPSPRLFRIVNNLGASFGLTADSTDSVLQAASFAVANLNHRLGEMQSYTSVSGFLEDESPLLFSKLAGAMALIDPAGLERQFERVIQIAGVPEFHEGNRIDVDRLLQLRDSAECREFRDWLGSISDTNDTEVTRMVSGLRQKIGCFAGNASGRVLRFAAVTAAGLVPGAGLAVGPALGAIDSFLVDKVLPHSGIFAFLSQKYPSLFLRA